jgi:hypothetical protein
VHRKGTLSDTEQVIARAALCAAAALLVAGCQAAPADPGAPRTAGGSTTPGGEETPFQLPPPCTLEVDGEATGLEVDRAVTLTDLAARALTEGQPAARLADALPTGYDDRATARALLGHDGPALTCYHGQAVPREEKLGPTGLTAKAERLRRAVRRAFGPLPMGGFAAGGVSTGHVDGSSHYDGRAMDVFFRPHTDAVRARRGWVLAQWLVARGARYDVLSVIYRDRIWTVWASSSGWREYVHPSGNRRDPVLRHLDHVHTAVQGGPWRGDDD